MRLLIYPAVDGGTLKEIGAVGGVQVVNAGDEAEALAVVAGVDALYGRITPALLAGAKRLRWVQAPLAGLEGYLFPELIESEVILTNMRGIYSDHIADQVMGYILMFARGLHVYLRRQIEHRWQGGVPVIHLADQTLGIVGLGGIGTEVARRGAVVGMRVIAVDAARREKPDFVAALWGSDRLGDLLREADFVAVCVPETPETVRLISAQQLRMMKRTAYLINIGRGAVVDLAALTVALQKGQIAGAGLDVFETEPLPADHPLWDMENVIVTPHTAATSPHVAERRLQVLKENLRRFVAGEPLLNVVDKRRWY